MIDIRPVGYILGWMLLWLGALMAAPLIVDALHKDPNAQAFGVSAVLTIMIGGSVAAACYDGRDIDLSLRQGFLLTTAAWTVYPAVAGLPLMLGEPGLSFTDAYFEFASALTTTGATVLTGLQELSPGTLLWRCLITWTGGIGVILLAMILLPLLNIGGMQLQRNADFETLGKIMPRAKAVAMSIGSAYVVLTLVCALCYVWTGLTGLDALGHAMSTIATGGMGNYDNSFAAFSPGTQYVGTVFMLIGSLSFIRYVQFARGEPRALFQDTQIRAFLLIYLCFVVALLISRMMEGDELDELTFREVSFNLASIISTTGFVSTDYSLWGPLAETLFFCAMMICGCSGSTAGGPKVFRYQILMQAISGEVRRLHSPNVVFTPRFQGMTVSDSVLDSVIAFLMLFFLTLGLGAVLLVLIGLDPVSAISGAAATLSNVGPGLGPLIGPASTFAGIPDPAKWVCSFLMLVGRLELLTAYVLFTPGFWRS
jgi:trk system potassium uptake protein TrkH